MRCGEARDRLDRRIDLTERERTELTLHLAECSDCARTARAAGRLDGLLKSAADDDSRDIVPLELKRQQVENRLRESARPAGIPAQTVQWFRHRPSIATAAVAAAVLLVFSLIPFKYQETIGYDVKMAGVDRELADDDERICGLLHELGLVEAAVDVESCDTTCRMAILDLKSRNEAFLVVGAISSINEFNLETDIVPIKAPTSSTLLQRAHRIITGGES